MRSLLRKILTCRLIGVACLGVIALFTLQGNASAVPCNIGYVDGSPNGINNGSYACLNGASNDSNESAADLAGFFGVSSWELLQKEDTPGGLTTNVDIGLEVTPDNNAPSGTWSFDESVWDTYSHIVIVVKTGRSQDNIYWSAYNVTSGDASGDWSTGGRGLSHLTVYGVPEPTTLILLGLGLVGLGFIRRKRV